MLTPINQIVQLSVQSRTLFLFLTFHKLFEVKPRAVEQIRMDVIKVNR